MLRRGGGHTPQRCRGHVLDDDGRDGEGVGHDGGASGGVARQALGAGPRGLGALPSPSAVARGVQTRFDVGWRFADGADDDCGVCDLVVISPHSLRGTTYKEGAAVEHAEKSKVWHYRRVLANFTGEVRRRVVIAAVDTYGRLGDELQRFIKTAADTVFENDTDGLRSLWTTLFRQRLSVALQKGNAEALDWFCAVAWPHDVLASADSERGALGPEPPAL